MYTFFIHLNKNSGISLLLNYKYVQLLSFSVNKFQNVGFKGTEWRTDTSTLVLSYQIGLGHTGLLFQCHGKILIEFLDKIPSSACT